MLEGRDIESKVQRLGFTGSDFNDLAGCRQGTGVGDDGVGTGWQVKGIFTLGIGFGDLTQLHHHYGGKMNRLAIVF